MARFAPSRYFSQEGGQPAPAAHRDLAEIGCLFFSPHKNSVTKDFYERCLVTACWHRNTAASESGLFVCQCAKSATSSCSVLLCFSNGNSVQRPSRMCDGFQSIHLPAREADWLQPQQAEQARRETTATSSPSSFSYSGVTPRTANSRKFEENVPACFKSDVWKTLDFPPINEGNERRLWLRSDYRQI